MPRGPSSKSPGLTYAGAGIDLSARERLVQRIREVVATSDPRVLAGVGPFASLFQLAGYRDPVIAASIDSVGTKLRLALILDQLEGLGFDIVNHCVNDVLTSGARPLFFLDYIGSSELRDESKLTLIEAMARACEEARCTLTGGETADMPGIYSSGDFDLVGVLVGACERDQVLGRHRVEEGDVLIALPSNGLHTNGYTLVRRVFGIGLDPDPARDRAVLERRYEELGGTLGEALLRPHRSYLREIEPVLADLHAMAHITGGGIEGNLARVIPDGLTGTVRLGAWTVPPLFQLIQRLGVDDDEVYRVFNMGLGMILVVAPGAADEVLRRVPESFVVGDVRRGEAKTSLEAPG